MTSTGVRYLNPDQIRAFKPEGATHLRIEIIDDLTIIAARVKRAFPMSRPQEFLSIQSGDNKEVGILRTLEGLEPNSRRLIEQELDRRYFTPVIERIDSLKMEAGMWRFMAQTQRGPADFFVRNWRDNAHEITVGRWQIQSVDGARFEIADLEALDPKSRKLMDQLL